MTGCLVVMYVKMYALGIDKLLTYDKKQWEEITQEVFSEIFRKSAVKRTKFSGLKRNIDALKKQP